MHYVLRACYVTHLNPGNPFNGFLFKKDKGDIDKHYMVNSNHQTHPKLNTEDTGMGALRAQFLPTYLPKTRHTKT